MAEWTQCPHCRLRHSARPDGTCPRCKQPLSEEGVADAPDTAQPPPAPQAMPDVFDEERFAQVRQHRAAAQERTAALPLGVRIAGAILLANGVIQLALRTVESGVANVSGLVGPWTASFDIVVGAVLLSNQSQVWGWAKVRVVFLGAGLVVLALIVGQAFNAGLQALFCAGLFLLLAGRATTVRMAAGAIATVVAMVLALCAAAPFVGINNPAGTLMGRLNGELGEAREALSGSSVPYTLSLAPGEWRVLNEPADEQEGDPSTSGAPDQPRYEISPAVRRPEALVDLRLFALQAPPGAQVDAQEVMTILVDDARDGLPEFLVAEDEWHDGAGGSTRILEGQARLDGRRAAVAVGLRIDGSCVFMLIGTTPVRMYEEVRPDLIEVYTSLRSRGC